jgi:hypothetical protein
MNTTQQTHTPGPWTLQPIGDETEFNILGAGRELIATVSDNDARLIAAAPELLAALEEVMDHSERAQEQGHYGGLHPHGPILERARAAIRKATGGA